MSDAPASPGAPSGNFLSAGFRELGRKLARSKLRTALRKLEADRLAALAALGQRAWEEDVDLAAFEAHRDRLAGLEAKAGELTATAGKLGEQQAALEQERRAGLEAFGARRKAVEEVKKPVDAALREARSRKSAADQAVKQAEGRLAAIAGRLATLERDIASLAVADPQQKLAGTKAEQAKLSAEQGDWVPKLATARASLPALAAEESRLAAESQKHAADLAAIEAEQRSTIGHIDKSLASVRGEAQGAARQAGAVQKDRTGALGELGLALLQAGVRDPALAEPLGRLEAIDRDRAGTQSAIDASLALTSAMGSGTMALFWGVLVGVPLLAAAIAYGAWQFLQRRAAPAPAPAPVAQAVPARPGEACASQAPPAHGEGVQVFADCARFEGTFVEGRLHGKGKKAWATGERMEGEFFAGFLHGPGVRVYRDGRRVEGVFMGGRPVGQGRITMKDGTVYEGRLWGPAILGWGVRRSPNGEIVAGDWREASESTMRPVGEMLRVRPGGAKEKVDASVIDPAATRPATPPAALPDGKLY